MGFVVRCAPCPFSRWSPRLMDVVGKMICDIAWRNAPMVYAVAFSANGTSFVAGGTSPNSAAVFDLVGNGYTCRTTSMLPALGGVYSAAINPSGQRVLFAGAGRHVRELTLA